MRVVGEFSTSNGRNEKIYIKEKKEDRVKMVDVMW